MKLMSTQTLSGCLEPLCRYFSILDLFIFSLSISEPHFNALFSLFTFSSFSIIALLNLSSIHQRGSLALADGDPLTPNWPSLDNAYR